MSGKKQTKTALAQPALVGGYSKMTKKRFDEIDAHLNSIIKTGKGGTPPDIGEIIKSPPPRATRGGQGFKLFDDDIDDILSAKKKGWTTVEIVMLFKKLGRSIAYSTVQNVVHGRIKKGRGLRSDAESR